MDLNKKQYYLDFFGFFSLGIISLGYVFLVRPFAELRIEPPFLNFPIFIGELLLFFCLVTFICKGGLRSIKRRYWLSAYLAFVLIKAAWGYAQFGPLAFRHSALFYYPLFIILASSFYRPDMFNGKKIVLISLLMIFISTRDIFNGYWMITFFFLVFILAIRHPNKIWKLIILAALFIFTSYQSFFQTSRMMMVANFATGIYLVVSAYVLLRINRIVKIAICIAVAFLILCMFFWSSDRNALMTLVRADKIVDVFNSYDRKYEVIKTRKKQIAEKQREELRTYNPDPLKWPGLQDGPETGGVEDLQLVAGQSGKAQANIQVYNPETTMMASYLNEEQLKTVKRDIQVYNPDPPLSMINLGSEPEELKGSLYAFEESDEDKKLRTLGVAYTNAVFRLLIWRDMGRELLAEKPVFGFHFGKPLRSDSLETLGWGRNEWERDGWIGAHNSFFHTIYRAGLAGLAGIIFLIALLGRMIITFFRHRAVPGILLCGIIINWLVAANFLLIFELPYTAIPIWCIYGIAYAHYRKLRAVDSLENK